MCVLILLRFTKDILFLTKDYTKSWTQFSQFVDDDELNADLQAKTLRLNLVDS